MSLKAKPVPVCYSLQQCCQKGCLSTGIKVIFKNVAGFDEPVFSRLRFCYSADMKRHKSTVLLLLFTLMYPLSSHELWTGGTPPRGQGLLLGGARLQTDHGQSQWLGVLMSRYGLGWGKALDIVLKLGKDPHDALEVSGTWHLTGRKVQLVASGGIFHRNGFGLCSSMTLGCPLGPVALYGVFRVSAFSDQDRLVLPLRAGVGLGFPLSPGLRLQAQASWPVNTQLVCAEHHPEYLMGVGWTF